VSVRALTRDRGLDNGYNSLLLDLLLDLLLGFFDRRLRRQLLLHLLGHHLHPDVDVFTAAQQRVDSHELQVVAANSLPPEPSFGSLVLIDSYQTQS